MSVSLVVLGERFFVCEAAMHDWRGVFAVLGGFWTDCPLTPVVCQRAGDSTVVVSG